uniref:NADH-ubiquinone oxidoreductase chain 2 n=1 Tax=Agrilus sp. AGR01 TaxID=1205534 RepID=A0A0S2MRN2_9COLE|nr:NADH deshydrogenase subunit 2 [Agrilus sp. AGR01]
MTLLYKIVFLSTLMAGTLVSISSNSWLGVWMGLEMNLLSFIPLMNNSKNPRSTEASLKYFISQALASMVLLMAMMINSVYSDLSSNLLLKEMPCMWMTTALFIKMGAAPFHFWFPEVMEGLSWMNALVLLTWQKIAPMAVLMYLNTNEIFMITVIITSTIIGGLMGLNQTSMRKIMAYSSINHISWMLSAMMFSESLWKWYFIIYSAMNLLIVWTLNKLNISSTPQITMMSTMNPSLKIFFVLNFFSMGGIPPFIGFLPKWFTIQSLATNQMYLMACLMIIITLITLYFYMRIVIPPVNMTNSGTLAMLGLKGTFKKKSLTLMNSILLMSLPLATMAFNWT